MTRADLTKLMALAMCAEACDTCQGPCGRWPEAMAEARAALAAVEAAGLRVVPAEATAAMCAAAHAARPTQVERDRTAFPMTSAEWRAMCAASPLAPPGEAGDGR